jgi:hypothetical protein
MRKVFTRSRSEYKEEENFSFLFSIRTTVHYVHSIRYVHTEIKRALSSSRLVQQNVCHFIRLGQLYDCNFYEIIKSCSGCSCCYYLTPYTNFHRLHFYENYAREIFQLGTEITCILWTLSNEDAPHSSPTIQLSINRRFLIWSFFLFLTHLFVVQF